MAHDNLGAVYAADLNEVRSPARPEVGQALQFLRSISHVPSRIQVPSLPDGTIDHVIAVWALEPRSALSQKSYSHDLHQFFSYWYTNYEDRHWATARTRELARFLGWYRHQSPASSKNSMTQGRSPATVTRMQAALSSAYDAAMACNQIIVNPVPRGNINATKGRPRSAANWLTPQAIETWRSYGINRLGSGNEERMLQNIRNTAYTDLVYGTGLRRQEAGGLLTIELPQKRFSHSLTQGWVPAALSKNSPHRGRAYYADQLVTESIGSYCEQQRKLDVASGQLSGKYENDALAEVVVDIEQVGTANAALLLENTASQVRKVRVKDLSLIERSHIYQRGTHGALEPMYLWLRTDGRPLMPTAWNGIFAAANKACVTKFGATAPRVTPHRLRHSFALRVFAASLIASVTQTGHAPAAATRALIDQGNIWIRLQNLLGHKSVETTRDYYLEPVTTLEWELIIRKTETSNLNELFTLVSALEPRIQGTDTYAL